ncbi:MAG: hypothetical protein R3E96_04865 [Planctomycetota bacterium]
MANSASGLDHGEFGAHARVELLPPPLEQRLAQRHRGLSHLDRIHRGAQVPIGLVDLRQDALPRSAPGFDFLLPAHGGLLLVRRDHIPAAAPQQRLRVLQRQLIAGLLVAVGDRGVGRLQTAEEAQVEGRPGLEGPL